MTDSGWRSTAPTEPEARSQAQHPRVSFRVNVLILGRAIVGPAAETVILAELPRTGQTLDLRSGRSIRVENVTITADGFDAIVAGPIARS
jgi:hypothetical protein